MMLTTPAGRMRRAELAEPERRQRRGRGRLGHDRISGEQGRPDLDHQQQQREVPGDDGRDDAERPVLSDHLLRAILLEHLERQIERGEVAEHRDREGDLPQRLRQRLALFLGQEASELVLLGFERFGQLDQQRPVAGAVSPTRRGTPLSRRPPPARVEPDPPGAPAVRTLPVEGLITSSPAAPLTSLPLINILKSVMTYSPFACCRLTCGRGLASFVALTGPGLRQRRDHAEPACS